MTGVEFMDPSAPVIQFLTTNFTGGKSLKASLLFSPNWRLNLTLQLAI
jgi:hypothetical protein